MTTSQALHKAWFLSSFECLGDACADTCCKGWGMQLTQQTVDKYASDAPELLDAVTSGEAEHIMKRDENTDYCVKFSNGWCGIHKNHGTEFLGDACHFYPRSTRAIGDTHVMSAALSCPEVTRLLLFSNKPDYDFDNDTIERVPFSLKDYKPDDLSQEQALSVHAAFLSVVLQDDITVERAVLRIRSVADSLPLLQPDSLALAVPFYLKQADSRLPEPQPHIADSLNLLNTLNALISHAKATKRERLMQTVLDMERALHVSLDHENLTVVTTEQTLPALEALSAQWMKSSQQLINPIMRSWLYGELSLALYPFSGLGKDAVDRITIIAVRYATVRLALQSYYMLHNALPEEEVVRIVQSLARFMDHLADAKSSLALYEQLGWTQTDRLRGLLEI